MKRRKFLGKRMTTGKEKNTNKGIRTDKEKLINKEVTADKEKLINTEITTNKEKIINKKNIDNKIRDIEGMPYLDENEFIDWYGKAQDYFSPHSIDDITDFDVNLSSFNFLVSLNKGNEGLSSEKLDTLLENDDAYFMEIMISRDKSLASMHFWKYPSGGKGGILEISEEAYLKEHKRMQTGFISFSKKNNLTILGDDDLKSPVHLEGKLVSLYYKYFGQNLEDPFDIPY